LPKIPGVNHLDAVRALEKAGFTVVRQGKHIVMSKGARILTIPRHNPSTHSRSAVSSETPA
jgi:predicted RNA binding protein YcfA (HicA-like mRNA interferase family)